MLKIGLVNLMILLSYKLFLGGAVNVTQAFPSSAAAGESFTIEINIEKGDHEGFAKWQQALPKGFSAVPLETNQATFSFVDGEVKLIWIEIPAEERFTISYKVTTSKNTTGNFELAGKFSYLEDNDRKTFDTEVKSIVIGTSKNTASAKGSIKTPSTNSGKIEVSEEVTSSDDITINRTITHLGEAVYQVDLKISKKEGLTSFGKVEEYLPNGFTASEINNEEGFFSLKRGIVKILWMTLPKKSSYTVSYQITSETDELSEVTLHGVVSYLDGDVSKQKPMKGSQFKNYYITEEEDAFITEEPIVEEVEEVEPTKIEKVTETKTVAKKPTTTTTTTTTTKGNNLTYRVQIASSKVKLNIEEFKAKRKIDEEVFMYQHKDWFMYTIGSFNSYNSAKIRRNELWNGNIVNDAFIVAFKGQKRISTQEALLISNERWSK